MPEETLYRVFNTLSHGERTKVLLAALFLKSGRFLLIDEPTDHLDEAVRTSVTRYLKGKKGFVLVSHDRILLDACVSHIVSINRGGIQVEKGNFSSWFENRKQKDASEWEKNRQIKKEIRRLENTAREKAEWANKTEAGKFGVKIPDRGFVGHKAAKAMKRSKSIENRIGKELEEKGKLLKNIEKADALKVSPLAHHKEWLIELKDISIAYGNKTVCKGIDLTVKQGERVVLKGRNGSGKSSVLKLILGQNNFTYTGSKRLASELVISYVSQDTSHLQGLVLDFAKINGLDESLFLTLLRKLDLPRVQFDKDIADFSSGQKKKVLLAKSLCEQAHIYIWDEPLNFIDVLSRIQIEDLIINGNPTMLFVEHDAAFTKKIATKGINLTN
jgi:lincosamide and streptogramin A transport system ATP-binding/permease protein